MTGQEINLFNEYLLNLYYVPELMLTPYYIGRLFLDLMGVGG